MPLWLDSFFRVQETPEETEIRLKNWENYLNSSKENDQNDDAGHPTNNDGAEKDYDSEGTRSSAGSGDETDEETKAKWSIREVLWITNFNRSYIFKIRSLYIIYGRNSGSTWRADTIINGANRPNYEEHENYS